MSNALYSRTRAKRLFHLFHRVARSNNRYYRTPEIHPSIHCPELVGNTDPSNNRWYDRRISFIETAKGSGVLNGGNCYEK